jgi:alpha/beta superfamily hydrolase
VRRALVGERPVEFDGPAGVIEGRVANETSGKGALVVLHPHPLYGGRMENNVVETVVRAGLDSNLTTLRFNFRGVGRSKGSFDQGTGEQDDVAAALDFLGDNLHPETKVLAGYSFGGCVALAYCHRKDHGVDHLVLISPPPFLLPEGGGLSLEIPVVRKIVFGENDEIAPPEEVKSMVSSGRVEELVEVIPGADHFYLGKEEELERLLVQSFSTKLEKSHNFR